MTGMKQTSRVIMIGMMSWLIPIVVGCADHDGDIKPAVAVRPLDIQSAAGRVFAIDAELGDLVVLQSTFRVNRWMQEHVSYYTDGQTEWVNVDRMGDLTIGDYVDIRWRQTPGGRYAARVSYQIKGEKHEEG